MLDVAGIEAELLTSGNYVTINVFDAKNHTPIATKGDSAAVLIAGGAGRKSVTLSPQGQNSLKGDAKSLPIAAGNITLTIKTVGGKSGQAKFKK